MADENWQQVREIFDNALCQKPEERARFINQACGEDKTLLAEVESLLSSLDSAESFMETPAVAKVAEAIEGKTKTLEKGRCFGHYEIIEQIGAGGMGEVYLAEDKKLDRRVAIKILNEKFSGNESNLQRFFAEAKAASSLNHPNILTIYEFGEAEDAHYIISEFVEGATLREIIRESRLGLSEILDISIQIAGALAAAHRAHLVHRDIKPENIMVRPDGYVKILDFGLAKLIQPKQALAGLETETARQNETAKGVIMGTVNYMSPEQAKGERVDERTDVFSFGAVIYEMIAGSTPFAGDSMSETFANLLNAEPPPLARPASNIPAELQRVVLKMLRKDKTERFQTMKDLSADLKNVRDNLSLEEKLERPALPGGENATAILQATTGDANLQTAETNNSISLTVKRYKSLAAFALAALLIGAVGLGYYFFNQTKTPLIFQAGQITRLTSSGRVKAAAVSPDGKFVIYAQEENNEQQSLWIQHVGSESNVQIAPPADIGFHSLNISPDSNSLYYHEANGTLYRMAVLGGTPKKVADKLFTSFRGEKISISPDSKQIAFVRKLENDVTALFIADADGANERILASFEQPDKIFQVSEWSPDGKIIACISGNAGNPNILAIQVADGTSSPILKGWFSINHFTWMPDSKSLMASGRNEDNDILGQIWQIQYPSGDVRQITNDTNNYEKINLTSDGRFLAAVRTEQIAQIWTMPGNDTNRARQLTAGFEKYDGTFFLGWMPDGKIIYDSATSGKLSGWVAEADGSNPRQLVKDGSPGALSPDGRYLIYEKTASDGLWRTDLKDGGEKQLTTTWDVSTTFSPNGKWIVYTAFHEQGNILRMSVEGGEPKLIFGKRGFCPNVSPDGKTLVCTVGGKISLISFEGGEIIKTFDTKTERLENSNKQNLQWTPDGRGIYFIRLNNGVSNIWRQPIDGSKPVQITKFETGRIFNFAYSFDGKQLALSRGSLNSDVVLIKNSE